MDKIRLGVIGTGLAFEELHAPALLGLREQFEIVALCNRTADRARRVAAWLAQQTGREPDVYTQIDDLLQRDDIDAVDVAVPINLTASVAAQALQQNKHVFAEKPIADNVEDGRNLIELAHKAHRVLAIGEQFRYLRRFNQMRELIESGVVGEALLYRLNDLHYTYLDDKYPSTAWRREGNFTGGYLLDGGVHTVAGMRAMVGSLVVQVHGLATTFIPGLSGPQHDTLLLNLRFANGMIGQMALGYGAVDHGARHPKVYGRNGTLTLFDDHIELWRTGRDEPTETIKMERSGDGFREEWLDFYKAVATGSALRFPPEEALADLQIILAGLESAETGAVVRLD
jgi:predicted dehydrogenase